MIKLSNIIHWFKRYIHQELAGTFTAILFAFIGWKISKSEIIAAAFGTLGENIGFYGVSAVREVHRHYKEHVKSTSLLKYFHIFYKTIRDILIEFGPAELFDTFLLRPYLMYIFQIKLNSFWWGIITGKLIADVFFYIIAIISYEYRRKYIDSKN